MKRNGSAIVIASAAVAVLAGCVEYVPRDEYEATIAELRQNQQSLRSNLDSTRADVAGIHTDLSGTRDNLVSLKSELSSKFQQYDASVSELKGRVRVDMSAHFDFDKAQLHDEDKAALDDFASVVRSHHPDALVTVEGFTDAAGSDAYNKLLGLKRARVVRDYLVAQGLNPEKLRTISYGKAQNRQVVRGAWGQHGEANRRVALVVDGIDVAETPSGTGTAAGGR
jgi:peptidoglycan-associated lipoprotein